MALKFDTEKKAGKDPVLQESVPALMNPSERCFKLAAQDKRRELEELFRAGGLDKDKKNAHGMKALRVFTVVALTYPSTMAVLSSTQVMLPRISLGVVSKRLPP